MLKLLFVRSGEFIFVDVSELSSEFCKRRETVLNDRTNLNHILSESLQLYILLSAVRSQDRKLEKQMLEVNVVVKHVSRNQEYSSF